MFSPFNKKVLSYPARIQDNTTDLNCAIKEMCATSRTYFNNDSTTGAIQTDTISFLRFI